MTKKICYCYNYTDDDIKKDVRENEGVSRVLEQILEKKKMGTCRCDQFHPEGR
ncbi:hypothetical protein [Pelovirga terrestris]|uniref:BFD-like (2Fe-2S) protein n=1 Tax=Pelovirga terrestris TaxID=2771352 RepID=A0A8J6URL4_9BACT|nr:hypothetical protein [Pelovirga terrestris]MBD1401551.1 hypothetical protein [Pelovirga terrestris]